MTRVWVLGGNGLVGEALKKIAGQELTFLSRAEFDLLNPPPKLPFAEGDTIVDLVPPPYPRDSVQIKPFEYHNQFTRPHCEFISKALKTGIKKYLFFGSGGTAYGIGKPGYLFKETDLTAPISAYGESKLMVEDFLLKEGNLHPCSIMIFRPSNIFNSHPTSPLQKGLIGIFKKRVESNMPLQIFGDLSIAKDYVSSEDVAVATMLALRKNISGIFNLGSGKVSSLGEIISAFERSLGRETKKEFLPGITNDVTWFGLDISKIQNELGFSPKVDVIKWIETNTSPQS